MTSFSGLFIFLSWVKYLFWRSKYLYAAPSIYQINLCFVSINIYKQYTGTHPCTLPGKWQKEEIYWHKNQVIWSIKQGSDGNQNETGKPKVTNKVCLIGGYCDG